MTRYQPDNLFAVNSTELLISLSRRNGHGIVEDNTFFKIAIMKKIIKKAVALSGFEMVTTEYVSHQLWFKVTSFCKRLYPWSKQFIYIIGLFKVKFLPHRKHTVFPLQGWTY